MHIYILSPKLLQWNFLQISQLSIWSGAHKLFCRFLLFAIFDQNFVNTVAPSSNINENYVVHLKEQSISILKKALKTASKSTHKPSHNTCLNYVPHAQADQTWHAKGPIFVPTADARSLISHQTLHDDIGRRVVGTPSPNTTVLFARTSCECDVHANCVTALLRALWHTVMLVWNYSRGTVICWSSSCMVHLITSSS